MGYNYITKTLANILLEQVAAFVGMGVEDLPSTLELRYQNLGLEGVLGDAGFPLGSLIRQGLASTTGKEQLGEGSPRLVYTLYLDKIRAIAELFPVGELSQPSLDGRLTPKSLQTEKGASR